MADRRAVHPDLVGPPGLQIDFQQRGATKRFLNPPPGLRLATVTALDGHLFAVRRMPSDGKVDDPFGLWHRTVDQGKVLFSGLAHLELPAQGFMGPVVFGDHQTSRRVLVQTVDNAGTQHAADPRQVAAMMQQGID